MAKMLTPLKRKIKRLSFVGFDIETYSDKNKFQSVAFYVSDKEEEQKFTTDRNYIFEMFKSGFLRDKILVATNLTFDFNGLFEKFYIKYFSLLYRGTKLLQAITYYDTDFKCFVHPNIYNELKNKMFNKRKRMQHKKQRRHEYEIFNRRYYKVHFADTLAYAPFGVAVLGKIIGVPKLECPFDYGYKCKTQEEFNLLKTYNLNDAKISKMFCDFFQEVTINLGGNVKTTISSSAVYLFRTQYLKNKYFCQPISIMDKIFNAYYGGRTEAFYHGKFNFKCVNYDINSLYPSVMLNKFPNPNTARITRKTSYELIKNFEGVSYIDVWCPNIHKPLLPYRTATKLYFPTGDMTGWYSHIELRKAVELGYVIKKIHETIYYELTCEPFKEYVDDLYAKKLQYEKEKSPMREIIKLYLNSFYGKLGEVYKKKENICSKEFFIYKDGMSVDTYDDTFLRVVADVKPKTHCLPIWAVYVTAYARLKLYSYLESHDVLYCDTDSILVREDDDIYNSSNLGDMKKEQTFREGFIIRPKFYGWLDDNKQDPHDKIKIKGMPLKYTYLQFQDLLLNKKATYNKFVQFKESMIRGLTVNEIITVSKFFKCEDSKRKFESQDYDKLYKSQPYNTNEIKDKPILYSEKEDFTYYVGFTD